MSGEVFEHRSTYLGSCSRCKKHSMVGLLYFRETGREVALCDLCIIDGIAKAVEVSNPKPPAEPPKKTEDGLRNYTVQFEHKERRGYFETRPFPHVESVDVHVEAPNGDEAVKRAREALGGDWNVRVVLIK